MRYTLKFYAEGVALVAYFGGMFLFEKARKIIKGDRTPVAPFPFVGFGPRRY